MVDAVACKVAVLMLSGVLYRAEELPDLAPDDLVLGILKWLGVPFVLLLALNSVFAFFAWKEAAHQAIDSYGRASDFLRRKRDDLAWQVPVLAIAQTLFIASVCCMSQLCGWMFRAFDGSVHGALSLTQWVSIAFSFDQVVELTKTLAIIALCLVFVIDFLVVTGREHALEILHSMALYLPGQILFGVFAGMFAFIGFLTPYAGDPEFAMGWYVLIPFVGVCWAALVVTAYAAREFATD
ncbi:hypothetical protein [Mycolicibacterium frederiksbergense]|uniref:Uncharacterized protein n=1 Tax=Mycolicibacterium frederiksbergense TaxID=117567 RepID=A0A6H0RYB8_9MYCO|nr:hypothetical protein [Mycolicibacterium frederiksbergense]QIV79960.1 hypothetical protein EXE63_02850 [Mycolicibacterium frederiksbergense]